MTAITERQLTPPKEPTPGYSNEGSVYELIREDIIEGRIAANERLKVSELAARHGTSTNPVREALQQLRGEGFVVMTPNRGARVRPIDEDFIRDIFEMEAMIEPYLTRWFVSTATDAQLIELEKIQQEIEDLNFSNHETQSELDTRFHRLMYDHHYNRRAVEQWWKHRVILSALSKRFPFALSRQSAILREHRALIECIRAQDADGAAKVIAAHVEGSGYHIIEHIRKARREQSE